MSPLGSEWFVDAHGCSPTALRSRDVLTSLFATIVADLELCPVREAVWEQFPAPGGLTGLLLLRESHLTCHTFPERGFAAFNLYCCRPHAPWPWEEGLREALGAQKVTVRLMIRGD